MARVKFRDFVGGLHATAQPDIQPRNTLQVMTGWAAPLGGRLRSASPPRADYPALSSHGAAGTSVAGMFRYNDLYIIEQTSTVFSITTHKLFRQTAVGVNSWAGPLTMPPAVNGGAAYSPDSVTGTQPAVTLVNGSKSVGVFSPAGETRVQNLYLLDVRNTGANAMKITDPTTGQMYRWGILPLTRPEVMAEKNDGTALGTGVVLSLTARNEVFINGDGGGDPFDTAANFVADPDPSTGFNAGPVETHPDDSDTLMAVNTLTAKNSIVASSAVTIAPAAGTSLRIRAGKDQSVAAAIKFTTVKDLTLIGSTPSGDEDFIQFYVRVRRPKHLENVEMAFSTEADGNFGKAFFKKELTFKLVNKKQRKKLVNLGDLIPFGKEQQFLTKNATKERDWSWMDTMSTDQIPVTKNTWTRITIPKALFSTEGEPNKQGPVTEPDWSKVKAIRVTVHANKEGSTAVFFDELKLVGGVGLMGDYKYTFTLRNSGTTYTPGSEGGVISNIQVRSNPPITSKGIIATVKVTDVERQGITLTFPDMFFDEQADRFEIWRTVGGGEAFFKVGEIVLSTPGRVFNTTAINDITGDYFGLNSAATLYSQNIGATGTFKGNAVLDGSLELPLDNNSPNDPSFQFQDAAGIHVGRMWWTRNVSNTDIFGNAQDPQGFVYYSPPGRYEAVQAYIPVGPGKSDPVQKILVFNDRMFALTKGAIYEIVGTDEPFVAQKIEGAPGLVRPGAAIATTSGLFYLATDGVYMFNGAYSQNITDKDLQAVFKWKEAVAGFPSSWGPDEFAVGKNALWMIQGGFGAQTPTLGSQSGDVLVFDFETGSWRHIASFGGSLFLYWDYVLGIMRGAGAAGEIDDLEPAPFNTASSTQPFVMQTPTTRVGSGQKGVFRKLFIDIDTAGVANIIATISVDGTGTNMPAIATAAGRKTVEYVINKPGEQFSVTVAGTYTAGAKVELYGVELDFYVPQETIGDSGLAGN